MERVAEDHLVAERLDVARLEQLDRALGRERHERRRPHLAVGELQRAGPRERATVPAPDHERSPHSGLIVVETVDRVATLKRRTPSDGGDGAEWNRMSATARRARYSVSVVLALGWSRLSEPSIVFGASPTEIATLRGFFASGFGM